MYGDGSGNALMGTALDPSAMPQQFLLTTLDFTGWKYITAQLPGRFHRADQPGRGIRRRREGRQTGSLWLDQLVTSNQQLSDAVAPTVRLSVTGHSAHRRRVGQRGPHDPPGQCQPDL